jgi:hypothetical protein
LNGVSALSCRTLVPARGFTSLNFIREEYIMEAFTKVGLDALLTPDNCLLANMHMKDDLDNGTGVPGRDFARAEILGNGPLGTLLSPHPEATLVDLQRPDLPFERRTGDPESGRRPRGPEDATAARAQGIFDDRLLVRGQCAGQAEPAVDRGRRGQPALVDGEFVGVGDDLIRMT